VLGMVGRGVVGGTGVCVLLGRGVGGGVVWLWLCGLGWEFVTGFVGAGLLCTLCIADGIGCGRVRGSGVEGVSGGGNFPLHRVVAFGPRSTAQRWM